jgi:uncharacterized tellurite resistance protein B-like protein
MLATLKSFLSDFTEGTKQPDQFGDDDYRLAVAALLVHLVAVDGNVSEPENAKLRSVLMQRFDLDESETDRLVAAATQADHEAVDLYHFTRLLNRTLDEAGRRRMVEMMWEIVYADGERTEFEDNIVWRVADLLGISSRERIELRQHVAARTASDAG